MKKIELKGLEATLYQETLDNGLEIYLLPQERIMKRILSLSLLGALPLIPTVSCTPLTISNENPQISN